jgi:hypothetical protein
MITKPLEGEYAPYFLKYIDLVPDEVDILEFLEDTIMDTEDLLSKIPLSKQEYSYADGKWTVKEILQHIIDTERIFTYRALCIAREDKTSLPGYDENEYAAKSIANHRSMDSLLDEFDKVRDATITLFKTFPKTALSQTGISNGNPLSVRAIAYILAGHELHHLNVIQERYL